MSKHLLKHLGLGALLVSALCATSARADFQSVLSQNLSGTVTTGGTFQSLQVQNVGRKGCLIENPPAATETLYVFFGPIASATTAAAVALSAGSSVSCQMPAQGTVSDQVSVTAATTGHAFVGLFQ